MAESACPCGTSPDPGIRPGDGCYCTDIPTCAHGWTHDCPKCLKAERDRFWQALTDIAGWENWQSKTQREIAKEALGDE